MWTWIADHGQTISAVSSLGMLLIWAVYLQTFLSVYRRQTRPRIVINRFGGKTLGSRCLLSNMSGEAIYVLSLVATLKGKDGEWGCQAVTDLQELGEDDSYDRFSQHVSSIGPLEPAKFIDVGSFKELVTRVQRAAEDDEAGVDALRRILPATLELTVVAEYGSESQLVGARRDFRIVEQGGRVLVTTEAARTEQIKSRWERRNLRRLLDETL